MSSITVDTKKFEQIISDTAKRDSWLRGIGQQMVGDIKLSMQQSPATGQSYPRGAKTHIASSPGNPPRIDMGDLVNSIDMRKIRAGVYEIHDGVEYGLKLEMGLGVAARPFMRPVFNSWNTKIANAAKRGQLV